MANTNITTKKQTLPADLVSKLLSGIAESRATTVVAGGGKPLLRLLKSGDWVFGASNEEVQEGSTWVINTMSLTHGYTCWVEGTGNDKNELRGEVMVSVAEHMPQRPAPIEGFPYKEQRAFEAKCLTGADEGTEVLHKTNSVGGLREMDALLAKIHAKLAAPGGANFPCPVVELKSSSYTHKKWGQIYNPIFDLVGWASMSGELEDGEVEQPKKAPVVAITKKAPVKSAGPAPTQRAHETGQRRRPAAR
jgi:hypothetical protein